jgi:hypothetical protein
MRTRRVLRRISAALKDFAKHEGWTPGAYQVFFRVLEDWGRISVLFVAPDFKGLSEREMWDRVTGHAEKSLKQEGEIGFSLGVSVRTQEQVDRDGDHSIPDGYVEEELLIGPGAGA